MLGEPTEKAIKHFCIDYVGLSVAIHNRADIHADPLDFSAQSYRKAAYRQYTLWVHGHQGRGNRKVIPSCVVVAVRIWYPSPTGMYMGFKEY